MLKNKAQILHECTDVTTPALIQVNVELFESREIPLALENLEYFVARVDRDPIYDKQTLLQAVSRACEFPDYFGFNWDALLDCLSDFHWRPAAGYILLYQDPTDLDQETWAIFLDVFQDVHERWTHRSVPFKLLIPEDIMLD